MKNSSIVAKKQKIKSSIIAGALSCTLLSGCGIDKVSDSEMLKSENTKTQCSTVEDTSNNISEDYDQIIDSKTDIKFSNLIKSHSLFIDVDKMDSLRWLNYCLNLKELTLSISSSELLKQIIYLPNLESLTIINPKKDYKKALLYDNCKFMIRSNKLKYLRINNMGIEPDLVESISNLEVLNLDTSYDAITINYDFNYDNFLSLKKIIVNKPLSLMAHVDNNFIDMINSGVRIYMNYEDDCIDITDYIINDYNYLNDFFKEIDINDKDLKIQSIKKIMNYIDTNYSYAYEIVNNGSKNLTYIYNKFYKYGYLYGIFNEEEIVCGNYSALFSSLASRVGIDSLVLIGNGHAWNMVSIDDNKYFVDILDESIVKLENIDMYDAIINLPEYITDEKEDDFKEFKLVLASLSAIQLVL